MMQCLVNIIKRHNTIADLFVPVLLVMWIAIQNIPGITVIGGIPAVRVTLVVPVAPAVVAGVAVKKVIEKICF